MAFSLVASIGQAAVSGSGCTTGSINTTGADLIVIVVSWYDGITPSPTLSDSKGNTWTGLTKRSTAANIATRIFYCKSPTVGSGHTFTISGATTFAGLDVQAWSGVDTTTPFDVENGNAPSGSSTTIQPGSVTPANNGSLIVSGICIDNPGGTYSIDSSLTISSSHNWVNAVTMGGAAAYLVQTSAAAINPTWTISNSVPRSSAIAVFKADGGGGTTFTKTLTVSQAQTAARAATAQLIKSLTQGSTPTKQAAISSTRAATQASTGSKVAQAQSTKTLTQASTALIVKAVAAIKTVTQASTATRNRLWSQALTATQSAAASITSSVIPAGTLVFNWIVHWTRRGRRKR